MSDVSIVLSEALERMGKSLDVLKLDLQKIRTGRCLLYTSDAADE